MGSTNTDITFHTNPQVDLSDALVIIGAPTIGLVGTITARYLIDALEIPSVGGIHSPHFPPITHVVDGVPSYPVRIHTLDTSCGLGLKCNRIVVITTEFMPSPHLMHRFSDAVMRWAKDHRSAMVIVLDGVPTEDRVIDEVYGVATTDAGLDILDKAKVPTIADGTLMGLSAALLVDGLRLGVDTLCILAESNPEHPDARAAALLVEILDQVLPDIKVEKGPLIEKAEEIENMVRKVIERFKEQADQMEPAPVNEMMFR